MLLSKALKAIQEQAEGNWDKVFKASQMKFESLKTIYIDGRRYSLTESAKRLITTRLRIPREYLERCPEDLQAKNLNDWLGWEGFRDTDFFCRFKSDRQIRAFFTPRYRPIDNIEIANHIQEAFSADTNVHFKISDEMMLLSIPDERGTFRVGKDEMLPGCCFGNSEVGLASFSCSAFYLRLACTNGLIVTDDVSIKTRHIKVEAFREFHDTVAQVKRMAWEKQNQMLLTHESPVSNPEASIASFGHHFKLADKDIELVQRSFRDFPEASLWGIAQAFGTAAKAVESAEAVYKLQKVGGMILALSK